MNTYVGAKNTKIFSCFIEMQQQRLIVKPAKPEGLRH